MSRAIDPGCVKQFIRNLGKELAQQKDIEHTSHEGDRQCRPVVDPGIGTDPPQPGDNQEVGDDGHHGGDHHRAQQRPKDDVPPGNLMRAKA